MIILNTKEKRVCVEELPLDATNIEIDERFPDRICFDILDGDIRMPDYRLLPPGNWKILGLLSVLTKDQARDLVDIHGSYGRYKDYTGEWQYFGDPLDSFHSLLRSHNLDTSKNLLIMGEDK